MPRLIGFRGRTLAVMGVIQRKSLDTPDETRSFPKMVGQIARVGSWSIGRAVLDPGWRWSLHVGPLTGSASCQIHHVQVLLAGRLAIEMDDGERVELVPDEVVDVPPGHDSWVIGDKPVVILDVSGNSVDFGLPSGQERIVTTLLMSDIVDSTATATRLGDAAWKQLLADHNRTIRTFFDRFRGQEVNTTGDGFLATFASALSALRCAGAMRDAVGDLHLQVRIGVHTGEVDVLPADIGGLAVHAVARIMSLAGPSEVVASSVTRGLVEGSGLRFQERGRHLVKGLEAPVEVFLLEP